MCGISQPKRRRQPQDIRIVAGMQLREKHLTKNQQKRKEVSGVTSEIAQSSSRGAMEASEGRKPGDVGMNPHTRGSSPERPKGRW